MDYFYCLDDRIFRDIDATKSTKKTYDLKYITYTAQVIADTVEEGLISDNQAKIFWNDFINSDYKKRLKKKKLQKILDNSKCLENKDYKIFINCFYKEFRNLELEEERAKQEKNKLAQSKDVIETDIEREKSIILKPSIDYLEQIMEM